MSSARYAIRVLGESDGPRLVEFLRRFFLRHEPLNRAAGVLAGGRRSCPEEEAFLLAALRHDLSVEAADAQSGRMLGVIVNDVHRPGLELEAARTAERLRDPAYREMRRFLAFVDVQVAEKLREMFPGEDLTQVGAHGGSIDPAVRGQGILKALLHHSRELGKERGIPLIRADCSSIYSAKACEHLGFQKIFSLRYDAYQRDGKVVFPPSKESGDEIVTYIQRLN